MKRLERLGTLQLLRAVAAISVVLYHAAGTTTKYSAYPALSTDLLHYGARGVDLFFVISGFVMFYSSPAGTRASSFMRKRIERIVPLYWVFTLLFALLMVASPGVDSSIGIGHLLLSLGFVSFAQGTMPLIYVGWTLEYEMLFYATVTLALRLAAAPWRWVCIVLSTAVVTGFLAPRHPALDLVTSPRLLEFLAGVVVAQSLQGAPWMRREVAVLAVAALATIIAPQGGMEFLLTAILSSLIVYAAGRLALRNVSVPRLATVLGDASYSIYLVQAFTLPVCGKILKVLVPGLLPDLFVVVATLVTMVCGFLSYRYLELPLRNWLRKEPVLQSRPTVNGAK